MESLFNFTSYKRFVLLISFYTLIIFPYLISINAYGREVTDVIAPLIDDYKEITLRKFYEGQTITIKAKVTDNNSIEKVILSYRTQGEIKYDKNIMLPSGKDGSEYISNIIAEKPGIEFFILATDSFNNVSTTGTIDNDDFILVLTKLPSPTLPDHVQPAKITPLWKTIAGLIITGSLAATLCYGTHTICKEKSREESGQIGLNW